MGSEAPLLAGEGTSRLGHNSSDHHPHRRRPMHQEPECQLHFLVWPFGGGPGESVEDVGLLPFEKGQDQIGSRGLAPFAGRFDQLAEGTIDGTPILQDGRKVWKFVLMFCKSDEEVRANEFGLCHWGSAEPCSDCMCNRGDDRPWTDLSRTAGWRASEDMPVVAWKERIRRPYHPLVESKYCVDKWFFHIDLMHLADCKGTSATVFGSVVDMITWMKDHGPNRQERLNRVNEFMEHWYSDNPGHHRLPQLKLGNLRSDDGWSELHGAAVKAANTRAAAPLFRDMAVHFFTRDLDEHRKVIAMCDEVSKCYDILYGSPMFMPKAKIDELRVTVWAIGEHWLSLRELARTGNHLSWKVSPKAHKFQHLPMYCSVLNVRYTQCYAEESLIGTTARIWHKKKHEGEVQDKRSVPRPSQANFVFFLRLEA